MEEECYIQMAEIWNLMRNLKIYKLGKCKEVRKTSKSVKHDNSHTVRLVNYGMLQI